jgi:S1-C subfamily serine protease
MNKLKKLTISIMLVAIVALGITAYVNRPIDKVPQALLSDPQSESGGRSQCLANNCYSAPANLECRLVGDSCETITMGGSAQEYTPDTKKNGGDYAEFYMQRVVKNNEAMAKAGIVIGDVIERVNGVYAGSDLEFAKLVLKLPKGTTLQAWRNNKRINIVL